MASAASTHPAASTREDDPSASLFEDSTTSLWEESVGSGRVTPPYLRPELSEGVAPSRAQQEVAAAQARRSSSLAGCKWQTLTGWSVNALYSRLRSTVG